MKGGDTVIKLKSYLINNNSHWPHDSLIMYFTITCLSAINSQKPKSLIWWLTNNETCWLLDSLITRLTDHVTRRSCSSFITWLTDTVSLIMGWSRNKESKTNKVNNWHYDSLTIRLNWSYDSLITILSGRNSLISRLDLVTHWSGTGNKRVCDEPALCCPPS